MRDIVALTSTRTTLVGFRNIWCENCNRRTFSPRRTTFMGYWDMDWRPDLWWQPISLREHLDRGDGEGESMLCFTCWALNNFSEDPGADVGFFRAHDHFSDVDRAETAMLRDLAPDWSNQQTFHDERPLRHALMVRARENRTLRHPCFARRWFS